MTYDTDPMFRSQPVPGAPGFLLDYWRAYESGDYRSALRIAYEHQRDFDWEGEQPEHWSDEARYESARLGLISAVTGAQICDSWPSSACAIAPDRRRLWMALAARYSWRRIDLAGARL